MSWMEPVRLVAIAREKFLRFVKPDSAAISWHDVVRLSR
jgi:hypothetical protein